MSRSQADEPAQPSCFFYVSIGESNEAGGVFSEVSGIQAKIEITPFHEGGVNNQVHQMPGKATVENITLKRGIAKGNRFFKWFNDVLNGNVTRENITIKMNTPDGQTLYAWSLNNAFPCQWSTSNLNANSSEMVVETLVLAHEGFGATQL
jgi:phage tail-like protein